MSLTFFQIPPPQAANKSASAPAHEKEKKLPWEQSHVQALFRAATAVHQKFPQLVSRYVWWAPAASTLIDFARQCPLSGHIPRQHAPARDGHVPPLDGAEIDETESTRHHVYYRRPNEQQGNKGATLSANPLDFWKINFGGVEAERARSLPRSWKRGTPRTTTATRRPGAEAPDAHCACGLDLTIFKYDRLENGEALLTE